jgi:hypothetical protein
MSLEQEIKINEKVSKWLKTEPMQSTSNNKVLLEMITKDYFRTGSGSNFSRWQNPVYTEGATWKSHDEQALRFSDHTLPVLILGIYLDSKEIKYKPEQLQQEFPVKPEMEFALIGHQGGGMLCSQAYFYGTVIEPKSEVWKGMSTLSKLLLNSHIGIGGSGNRFPALDDVMAYEAVLKALVHPNLSCNNCYQYLEEAIYPVDFTPEAMAALTSQKLPDGNKKEDWLIPQQELDDLNRSWLYNFRRGSFLQRLQFFILGENCD